MTEATTGAEIENMLASAASEVLEAMFFAEVLGPASPAALDTSGLLTVELEFRGSPSGLFQMALPDSTARSIAATFLGEEECDIVDAQSESVTCELLNMIAGAALSKLESEVTFVLCQPHRVEPAGEFPSKQAVQCSLELENGFLHIAFLAKGPR